MRRTSYLGGDSMGVLKKVKFLQTMVYTLFIFISNKVCVWMWLHCETYLSELSHITQHDIFWAVVIPCTVFKSWNSVFLKKLQKSWINHTFFVLVNFIFRGKKNLKLRSTTLRKCNCRVLHCTYLVILKTGKKPAALEE